MNLSQCEVNNELIDRELGTRSFVNYNRYVCIEGEEPAKHHELLCTALDKVLTGEKKNLMVFMPPGSAKSTYSTIRFPAYYLSRTKNKGVICASYAETLATSFGRKTRNLVSSRVHQNLFNLTLAADSKAKGEWETSNGGFFYSCGVGGSVTGRRADLGLIDDPVKGHEDANSDLKRKKVWDWYLSDFTTRLKPGASKIIIQTRWHEDDLSGRILPETWNGESGTITARDGEDWEVICLPAKALKNDILGRKKGEWLWPEWFTPTYWVQLFNTMPKRVWSALFQQQPTADDGSFYKREMFDKRWSVLPADLSYYAAADFALTEDGGDYTEIGIFGIDPSRNIYVCDWYSGQDDVKVWINELFTMSKKWDFHWLAAEPGQIKKATESTIKEEMNVSSQFFTMKYIGGGQGKEANATSFKNLQSNGRVYWPMIGHHSTEDQKKLVKITDRVIEQHIKAFGGRYDDAIDATSNFGLMISKAWSGTATKPKKPDPTPNDSDNGLVIAEYLTKRSKAEW